MKTCAALCVRICVCFVFLVSVPLVRMKIIIIMMITLIIKQLKALKGLSYEDKYLNYKDTDKD